VCGQVEGICDELMFRPEKPYLLVCVVVCGLKKVKHEEVKARVGPQRPQKNQCIILSVIDIEV